MFAMNRKLSKNIITISRNFIIMKNQQSSLKKQYQFNPNLYEYSYSSTQYSRNRSTLSQSFSQSFSTKKIKSPGKNIQKQRQSIQIDQDNNNVKSNSQNQMNNQSLLIKRQKLKSMSLAQRTPLAVQTLDRIIQWRKMNEAPVDFAGCERLHDQNQPIQIQKYQTLIALILSVQTKDQTTQKVMERLKKYGLNPNKISNIEQQKLIQLIHESNFNRKKAKNIIFVSKDILKKGLPKSMQDLVKYPGIGVKIATLYMRTAQGKNQGIGVDTHVHRISERLGWAFSSKNPNQTEQQLQKLFPKDRWNQINIALVGFGQLLCEAKKPKCQLCPVSNQCQYKSLYLQF